MCLKAKHVDIKAFNAETATNRLRIEAMTTKNKHTRCFQFSITVYRFLSVATSSITFEFEAGQTFMKALKKPINIIKSCNEEQKF